MKFLFCGFCIPNNNKRTKIFFYSRGSSFYSSPNTSTSPHVVSSHNQKSTVIQANCTPNTNETTGLLYTKKLNLNVSNEEIEWRKSVIVLKDGVIEIYDIENDMNVIKEVCKI